MRKQGGGWRLNLGTSYSCLLFRFNTLLFKGLHSFLLEEVCYIMMKCSVACFLLMVLLSRV